MTCKICGKKLPEGSTTCKYCGTKLKTSEEAKRPGKRRYSKKGLARRRMVNLILIILALLAIVGVVAGIAFSAKQAGKSAEESQTQEPAKEETAENEDPIISEEEEEEDPIISEEEEELPEAATLEDPKPEEDKSEEGEDSETAEETTPAPETEKPAETVQKPTGPSGHYTVSINRTETTASLNHYRELKMSINETLPEGVEVVSTTWTSSDSSIVRAEDGKAWGVSVGQATVTGTLTLNDGQSFTASCVVKVVEEQIVTYSDYILGDSSTKLYTKAELSGLTNDQLRIARNEIYARHGRIFSDPVLQQYFEGKSWYKGTLTADQFDTSVLNDTERKNIDVILAVEAAR